MANEKKIEKNQKHLLYQLGEALKLEEKLSQEQDSKKQAKIQKKIESSNKMILYYGKNIGQEGGTLDSIWDQLTERQQQIIQELFPYGTEADNLGKQRERGYIIKFYKKDIQKVLEAEKNNPPYDPNLPVKEKLKNKRYKAEVDLGWYMYLRSKKDKSTYEPIWNYEEHFANTVEFSEEERQIIERCYQIGKEYDEYNNQKFAFVVNLGTSMVETAGKINEWGDKNQAQKWSRNMYTMIFPNMIRDLHPEKKYSSAELETMGKELTRRFLQFIGDRESLDQYRDHWNQLMQSPDIAHFSDHQKETLVLQTMIDTVGSEKAWFTAMYNNIPQTKEGIELLLNYSYEELGLA